MCSMELSLSWPMWHAFASDSEPEPPARRPARRPAPPGAPSPEPHEPTWLLVMTHIAQLIASLSVLALWGGLRTYGVINGVDIPPVIDGGALIVAGALFPGGLRAAASFLGDLRGKGDKHE